MNVLAFQLRSVVVVGLCLLSLSAQALDVVVSDNDARSYRYLELENKLQVLLISDPSASKAAAALDVYVGSNQNSSDREGLAHFLEHMLFLGTEKYPEPGEYQTFISDHGGTHNAYTSSENTNYFFDIDADYLEQGLDRFAQFFIAPLFTAKYVDRERHAVHSEYKLKIKNEYRRAADVYSEVVNPAHPLAKFAVGNLETLADRELEDGGKDLVRDDLLAFYRRYYSANLMALVVLGREPLDALEKMTVERFAQVANHDVVVAQKPVPLFLDGVLPAKLSIKPLREERRLTLSFALPDSASYYREKPLSYIGNLLGHEGEGSLLSFLKKYGWAEGLSAGGGNSTRVDGSFDINISLTERGVNAVDQIVSLTFHVIDNLRRKGIKAWRFEEDKKLGEISFRFQEKADAMATVSALASRLHQYAPEDVLRGPYYYGDYQPELIKRFVDYLTPENLLLTVVAPEVQTDRVSHWYQTHYRFEPYKVAEEPVLDRFARQLYFPAPNPFIPQRLGVKSNSMLNAQKIDAELPENIVNADNYHAWFKLDSQFKVPRANINLRLKLPMAAQSVRTAAMNKLFVALVEDSLNEFAYPASLAGLDFELRDNSRGIDVELDGYNDRQGLLLSRIIDTIRRARFEEERFASIKRELIRTWKNSDKAPPYQQLAQEVAVVQFSPLWGMQDLAQALEPVSYADFNGFAAKLLTNASAEALFYGNLYRQEALKLSALVQNQLLSQQGDVALPPAQVVKLSGSERERSLLRELPIDHKDSSAILYLQGREDTLADRAKMLLLRQLVSSPFFHQLRTEKQLGYVVMASSMGLKKVPGTIFVVQSPVADSARLIDEIAGFIDVFIQRWPADLSASKQAVRSNLLEAPQNMAEQAGRYWDNVLRGYPQFDRRQQLAAAVERVDSKELLAYFKQVTDVSQRLWLVSSRLPDEVAKGYQRIDDALGYKREAVVYAYP